MKDHDYLNTILQLFLHVPPIRNFFLDPTTPQLQESARPTELVKRLSELARRLWNPRLFKSQVSPHEFLQEVTKRSGGKFKITEKGDPVEFLSWLINNLHKDLGGTKKRSSSVIYSTFQGKVQIETQQIITHKEYSRPIFDVSRGDFSFSLPSFAHERYPKDSVTVFIPRIGFSGHAAIHRFKREENHPTSPIIRDPSEIRW